MTCPLENTVHAKPALPHKAVHSKLKRCLQKYCRDHPNQPSLAVTDIRTHISTNGLPYSTSGRFITTSNLSHQPTLFAFNKAQSMVEDCAARHRISLEGCEITIILRCSSLPRLKFRYYIVDHANSRVRWLHGKPKDVAEEPERHEAVVPSRMWVAYWEHMALFPTHRFCSVDDYKYALGLLDDMRVGALDDSIPRLDSSNVETLSTMLRRFDPMAIDQHTTASVAKTIRKIFEHSVTDHRPSAPQRAVGGAMKSLTGILSALTGWTHDRDPRGENVDEDRHPTEHNTPDNSPRSSRHIPYNPAQAGAGTNQAVVRHRVVGRADPDN